jgi:hypothetical protein
MHEKRPAGRHRSEGYTADVLVISAWLGVLSACLGRVVGGTQYRRAKGWEASHLPSLLPPQRLLQPALGVVLGKPHGRGSASVERKERRGDAHHAERHKARVGHLCKGLTALA